MKMAITGGAGFIGSHLADALIAEGHEVLVIDDLSFGQMDFVNKNAIFLKKDIRHGLDLQDFSTLFHFAANPDVRICSNDPFGCFDVNVKGTFEVLESCRKFDVKNLIFASTSTVYGESNIPTAETHSCNPISHYGASKLCSEAFISSYSSMYGIKSTVLRFANIFGPRGKRGVMHDFFFKLKKNPNELEILGDGKQQKSYLNINDAISAILIVSKSQSSIFEVFNVGSLERESVDKIALLVSKNMGLSPTFFYSGTMNGWKGDVSSMLLDCQKLRKLGWKTSLPFEDALKRYIKWLSSNY